MLSEHAVHKDLGPIMLVGGIVLEGDPHFERRKGPGLLERLAERVSLFDLFPEGGPSRKRGFNLFADDCGSACFALRLRFVCSRLSHPSCAVERKLLHGLLVHKDLCAEAVAGPEEHDADSELSLQSCRELFAGFAKIS